MQEWFNWTLSKSVVGQPTESSNLSLSAKLANLLVGNYIHNMEGTKPEDPAILEQQKVTIEQGLDATPISPPTDTHLPKNAIIDEMGRILVPRFDTRNDKRLRKLFEKRTGQVITTYIIAGRVEPKD